MCIHFLTDHVFTIQENLKKEKMWATFLYFVITKSEAEVVQCAKGLKNILENAIECLCVSLPMSHLERKRECVNRSRAYTLGKKLILVLSYILNLNCILVL